MHKTYDQFVWVPVDKNNVILDLSTTYATLDEAGIMAKVQEQINAGKYPMAIKVDATNYINLQKEQME